jgi:hypothetical protein
MLNEDNLGINLCSISQLNNNTEHFGLANGNKCNSNSECNSNKCKNYGNGKRCYNF